MIGINSHNKEHYKYSITVISPNISNASTQKLWDNVSQSALDTALSNSMQSAKNLNLSITGASPVYKITYETKTKDKKAPIQLFTQLLNNANQIITPIITSTIQNLKNKIANQKILLNKATQESNPAAIQAQVEYTNSLNELDSIYPKLSTLKDLSTVITPAHGISFVITLAILLSLLMSLITVFVVKAIVTIRDEIKE
jgi:hypothetical protein